MGKRKGGKRLTRRQLEGLLRQYFVDNSGEAVTLRQLYKDLGLDTHPLKMLAAELLDAMAWDDYLTKVDDSTYRLNTRTQVQEGRFRRKANGKNSFIPDDGTQPVFVAERNSMSALEGDRVRVSCLARRKNHIKEAVVTAILQRARNTFVGTIRKYHLSAMLITEESMPFDVLIPQDKVKSVTTGDKAVVEIVEWPGAGHKYAIGKIKDILGRQGDNNVEMNAILAAYDLPYKYPQNVVNAAEKISDKITPEDIAGREDFRGVFTCTIDPHDAKDFDDALSIRPLDTTGRRKVWEVGVHIADVTHYVTQDSVINHEAEKRATSVYLVDRTIPMLPDRLCNYICSLRPDEDKLAYSVVFDINSDGDVLRWRLVHTVIRSVRRYAYEEVQEILESNGVTDGTGMPAPEPGPAGYKGEHAAELVALDAIAKKLRAARFKNGSVRFDREELHFDVDEKGNPTRCYYKTSRDANKLIEEFMLLANRTVAESVGNAKDKEDRKTLPYRVHDQPDPQKLEALRSFVGKFGYKMKTTGTAAAVANSMNSLLDACAGKKEQKLIETIALRSMMKARYSVFNIGHYGLAFKFYTHFTSPIRRYPDMMVHRLLSRYAKGARSANSKLYEEICEHCSAMEQTAQNAERESIKYKMVEFMSDKIGNVYKAHISGIQSYGIYCEIDENHCEGMVPMRDLDDDYYDFDEKNYCLVGRRRNHKYQLGDEVMIRVARANLEKRQLDFTIA